MPTDSGQGLVVFQSNEDLDREEAEAAARKAMEQGQNEPVVIGLAAYVRGCWEAARIAKQPHQRRMMDNLRQRAGEYSPTKLAQIQADGGSEIFMMLTDEKCNAAESWIEEILSPAQGKVWSIHATPIPELPQAMKEQLIHYVEKKTNETVAMQIEQMQTMGMQPKMEEVQTIYDQTRQKVVDEVKKTMTDKIDEDMKAIEEDLNDHVAESGWTEALMEVIEDLVCFPCGILKGPVVKRELDIVWGPDGTAVVGERFNKYYERVSPLDIYPSPSSLGIDDGYLIQRHDLTRSDLDKMRGLPGSGYDDAAISEVLQLYGRGGLRSWLLTDDSERRRIEGKGDPIHDPEARIEAIQFWGSVSGLFLLEWGLHPDEIEDPVAEYHVEAWLIGPYVIKAEVNGDPLGRKPYYKASFRKRNGQFWGDGLPELITDVQDACNAAIRNLLNNVALSSGPMVGVDVGAFADGEKITKIKPWKIWQFDLKNHQQNKTPLWFFQPKPMVSELLTIYEKFSLEADNKSGIPKYAYGVQQRGGAMETATGLSMMMGNATRSVKKVVKNIDTGIITKSIKRLHEWLLVNEETYAGRNRGDIEILSKGSSSLVAKEQQQVRRNEFLQIILGSEAAQAIMGMPGIAEVLRKVVIGLDIGLDDEVVPSKETMEQQGMAMGGGSGGGGMAPSGPETPEGEIPPGKQQPKRPKQLEHSGARKGGKEVTTTNRRM